MLYSMIKEAVELSPGNFCTAYSSTKQKEAAKNGTKNNQSSRRADWHQHAHPAIL